MGYISMAKCKALMESAVKRINSEQCKNVGC